MRPGHWGMYRAEGGDAYAVCIRHGIGERDGVPVDRIAVLADTDHGSGLDTGWNVREAKEGDEVGDWSPHEVVTRR